MRYTTGFHNNQTRLSIRKKRDVKEVLNRHQDTLKVTIIIKIVGATLQKTTFIPYYVQGIQRCSRNEVTVVNASSTSKQTKSKETWMICNMYLAI